MKHPTTYHLQSNSIKGTVKMVKITWKKDPVRDAGSVWAGWAIVHPDFLRREKRIVTYIDNLFLSFH